MAFLIPDNLKSRPDVPPALRRVATAFQIALDEDVLVWFEPLYDPAGDKPHFVLLLPDRGIVVLEVFEAKAKNILGFIRGRLRFERDGREVEVHSPMRRAELHAEALRARIGAEERLRGLDLPVVAGAVFPELTESEAEAKGISGTIDPGRCLFRAHVEAGTKGTGEAVMLRAFTRMLGGRALELDGATVEILRGLINPSIVIDKIKNARSSNQLLIFRPPSEGADLVRVMDRKQEAMAKSLGEGHRVIRGVAGSGKTLILVYRARLVAQANPKRRYLLTCYTKALAGQLEAMLEDVPNVTVQNLDAVMADVIRSAGARVPRFTDDTSGELFARAALQALRRTRTRFDGIFVDEAQDFGTSALQFVVGLLAEGSDDLVIVADAAQNIFRRNFSWKQAGIQAQGRTRILRTNYRNTREILDFAYRFLTGGDLQAEDLVDLGDETAVIPPEAAHRSGPEPTVVLTRRPEHTVQQVIERVQSWLLQDRSPRCIAILYASSRGSVMAADLPEALKHAGIDYYWATDPRDRAAKLRLAKATQPVILSTIHSAKGLEFPRVALCELGKESDEPDAARKLSYVGMTRATEELFVVTEESNRLASDLEASRTSKRQGSAA